MIRMDSAGGPGQAAGLIPETFRPRYSLRSSVPASGNWLMRVAILGQQAFGQAVLEAFVKRGDTVAGVFCAPEKAGAPPDALRVAAEQAGIRTYQFASLKTPQAHEALRSLAVDLGVMAYVLQFVPQEFASIPRHGTIQYHPSLLPRYRGPSSINWKAGVGPRRRTSTGTITSI